MSLDLLGEGFDLHGGGQDLAFPHHENERAQAVALGGRSPATGCTTASCEVEGEKMSKCLGNFTNLLDLIDTIDPRAYRLLVLRAHYRSPVEITARPPPTRRSALDRLDAFARRTASLDVHGRARRRHLARFGQLMDDDLDTPGVVDLVFRSVRQVNNELDRGDVDAAAPLAAAVAEICEAVGIDLASPGDDVPVEVAAKAAERDAARAASDWVAADRLRDELEAEGWTVEDTAAGTSVRRR